MEKLLVILGAVIGSWLGWWAGAHVGLMTAWILSVAGLGLGLYWGRRIGRDYF